MDMRYAESLNNNLQNALDRAALAAVANPNLSPAKRQAFAEEVFVKSFSSKHRAAISFTVEDSASVFSIAANVKVPTTLGAMIDLESFAVSGKSSAQLDEEGSICVLSLAEDGADRLYFDDGISFNAAVCAVHVNSKDQSAITNAGSGLPTASSFCAAGSGKGSFKPGLNSECAVIADPHASLEFPAPDETCEGGGTKIKSNGSKGVEQTIIKPGVYCGGLTVSGTNVDFDPGTYIIQDGELRFRKDSNAIAYGVTFILLGEKSILRVEHGAEFFVRAPKSGPYAGIAFAQQPPAEATALPTGESRITSSGHLDIEGTLYFPTQALDIKSDSRFGSRSMATSFIAYEMSFTGDSIATVSMD